MRNYYPGITIFKLAGALLVLVAHAMLIRYVGKMPSQSVIQFTSLPTRIVVPCFYVISGFLAYMGWSNAANPRTYVKRYVLRITFIYCLFCLVFIIQFIVPALIADGLTMGNLLLQSRILFMMFVLNGPFLQFWFIPPLLFGVIVVFWFSEKSRWRIAVRAALSAYVLIQFTSGSLRGLFGDTLGLVQWLPILSIQHWEYIILFLTRYVGFGFTFVLVGALIAKYEDMFLRLNVSRLFIIAAVVSLIEVALLTIFSEWDSKVVLAFCILPNTILLFYGVLKIKVEAIRVHHHLINLFSIITFCTHIPFMVLNVFLLGWKQNDMTFAQNTIFLLLTLVECIALTLLLNLKRKPERVKKGLESANT